MARGCDGERGGGDAVCFDGGEALEDCVFDLALAAFNGVSAGLEVRGLALVLFELGLVVCEEALKSCDERLSRFDALCHCALGYGELLDECGQSSGVNRRRWNGVVWVGDLFVFLIRCCHCWLRSEVCFLNRRRQRRDWLEFSRH